MKMIRARKLSCSRLVRLAAGAIVLVSSAFLHAQNIPEKDKTKNQSSEHRNVQAAPATHNTPSNSSQGHTAPQNPSSGRSATGSNSSGNQTVPSNTPVGRTQQSNPSGNQTAPSNTPVGRTQQSNPSGSQATPSNTPVGRTTTPQPTGYQTNRTEGRTSNTGNQPSNTSGGNFNRGSQQDTTGGREGNTGRTFGRQNDNAPANNPGQNTGRRSETPGNPQPAGRTFGNQPVNAGRTPEGRTEPNRGPERPANNLGSRPGSETRQPQNASRPVYRGPNNTEVHYRSNGQPQVVHTRDMTITHTPAGVRRVVVERPDHTVIVASGAGHGYVQRPFVVRNTSYVQRTYLVGGVSYTRVYRPYVFRGISLNIYAPVRYYSPAYYGWVYTPWGRPVVYRWGWFGSPWYTYYGAYFTPYPSYMSATLWLTDYIIATTLDQAYQERQYASVRASLDLNGPTTLTPQVKQVIADEVGRQINEERAESQAAAQGSYGSGTPSFLTDNQPHVFVVSNALDVMSRTGECSLTEGDVVQMAGPPMTNTADVVVLASKGMDCRRGETVIVGLADLQEMQNHMRATLDQGLAELQSHNGQGGLPLPPAGLQPAAVVAPYAAAAPPPDPNVSAELNQQTQAASQAEGEVLQQADAAAPDNGAAPTVSLGMSIDDVVNILGKPDRIADLGSRKTYFYGSMKVLFTDGRVTDIQ